MADGDAHVLAARFGNRWSTMWAQAGFNNSTTAIPKRIEERLGLGLSLANFFTDNPSYEVKSMDVTADRAKQLRDAALAAQQVLMAADVTLKTAGDERDIASRDNGSGRCARSSRFLDGTLERLRSALALLRTGDAIDKHHAGQTAECDGAFGRHRRHHRAM